MWGRCRVQSKPFDLCGAYVAPHRYLHFCTPDPLGFARNLRQPPSSDHFMDRRPDSAAAISLNYEAPS